MIELLQTRPESHCFRLLRPSGRGAGSECDATYLRLAPVRLKCFSQQVECHHRSRQPFLLNTRLQMLTYM
jgi:hypothetical protein